MSNTPVVTCGAVDAYPFGAPPVFNRVDDSQSLIFYDVFSEMSCKTIKTGGFSNFIISPESDDTLIRLFILLHLRVYSSDISDSLKSRSGII